MCSLMRYCLAAALLAAGVFCTASAAYAAPPKSSPLSTELGSPNFYPTAALPVGWRGDGTGRYPAATPPTSWEMHRSGAQFAAKGFLWGQPLPATTVSSPIIVGDRIF